MPASLALKADHELRVMHVVPEQRPEVYILHLTTKSAQSLGLFPFFPSAGEGANQRAWCDRDGSWLMTKEPPGQLQVGISWIP